MLEIEHPLSLKKALQPEHGDIETLLERLLLEVAGLNYRYFLQEKLALGSEYLCEPPLLANERQVSGLFFQALSSVCPLSRPEVAIRRADIGGRKRSASAEKGGRVDFFATHGRRSVAIELKRVAISTQDSDWKRVARRWKSVTTQAHQALRYMSKNKQQEGFKYPVGVGLLAIRVGRNIGESVTGAKSDEVRHRFNSIPGELRKHLRPDFLAVYHLPKEMQIAGGYGEGGENYAIFPGLIFAASVHLRT